MKKQLFLFLIVCLIMHGGYSQDTFSIVAVDSATGEVGSAGASCVDLTNFPGLQDDFLGELFPNLGAINTQAYYLSVNQLLAQERMNAGDTPSEIINWLIENDVQNQPELRQYGVVAFVDGAPQSAAHTGSANSDYKNHVLGSNYAIQGNILLGQEVLDSMEARFLNEPGDLACKLMAALQGANMVGADTRCSANGTSSLFAFLKVAQPSDEFGNPSFLVSVRTPDGAGIEPIDSLQTKFDLEHTCSMLGVEDQLLEENLFLVYPNPATNEVLLTNHSDDPVEVFLFDALERLVYRGSVFGEQRVDVSALKKGAYHLKVQGKHNEFLRKLIIQ